jgi:hypothetical protein
MGILAASCSTDNVASDSESQTVSSQDSEAAESIDADSGETAATSASKASGNSSEASNSDTVKEPSKVTKPKSVTRSSSDTKTSSKSDASSKSSTKSTEATKQSQSSSSSVCYITVEGYCTNKSITLQGGDTVYSILKRTGASVSGSKSYVKGINGLYEFDKGPQSGWMYSVNGSTPNVSCGSYKVKAGDKIKWYYVTSY